MGLHFALPSWAWLVDKKICNIISLNLEVHKQNHPSSSLTSTHSSPASGLTLHTRAPGLCGLVKIPNVTRPQQAGRKTLARGKRIPVSVSTWRQDDGLQRCRMKNSRRFHLLNNQFFVWYQRLSKLARTVVG